MSTDWGGVLGTVVVAGVATKMTQNMFNNSPLSSPARKKTKKKTLTTSKQFFNSPW